MGVAGTPVPCAMTANDLMGSHDCADCQVMELLNGALTPCHS